MKETETLVLTKGQTFWHYSVIPFLLLMPVMTAIDAFKYYVTHTYNSTKPIDFTFGYIWILPAILFYFLQRHRLKFKTIDIKVDNEGFFGAVKQTANELEWNIIQVNHNIIIAKSGFSWRSWGEQITIIHEKDKILFNSICDPDNRPSIVSGGMNRINRKVFEQMLKQKCV